MKTILLLLLTIFLSGCSTPGGFVIGPISSYTSGLNEKRMLNDSILNNQLIPSTKKPVLLQAVNMGFDKPCLVIGFGIDLVSLVNEKYTWKEIITQMIGVLGDSSLYTGIGLGVNSLSKSKNDQPQNIVITGNGNNITLK